MYLSDFQQQLTFEREIDAICRLIFEYNEVNSNRSKKAYYAGKMIGEEFIRVVCYEFDEPRYRSLIFFPEMRTFEDEPKLFYFDVDYSLFENRSFEEIKEDYKAGIFSMRLLKMLKELDEGFVKGDPSIIETGPSKRFNSGGMSINYNYHFSHKGKIYDVYGYNDGRTIDINFQPNGDPNYSLQGETVDHRALFGLIVQCAMIESDKTKVHSIKFSTKYTPPKQPDTNKKAKKTLFDLYDSKYFKEAVKQLSGFSWKSQGQVGSYYAWYYSK